MFKLTRSSPIPLGGSATPPGGKPVIGGREEAIHQGHRYTSKPSIPLPRMPSDPYLSDISLNSSSSSGGSEGSSVERLLPTPDEPGAPNDSSIQAGVPATPSALRRSANKVLDWVTPLLSRRKPPKKREEPRQIVRELVQGKGMGKAGVVAVGEGQVVEAFDRDMKNSAYYLGTRLLCNEEERKLEERRGEVYQELARLFGDAGFRNIGRILGQALLADLTQMLSQSQPNRTLTAMGMGSRYSIVEEEEWVRLTVESDFRILDIPMDLDPEQTLLGHGDFEPSQPEFAVVRREVRILRTELVREWESSEIGEVMPSLGVRDSFSNRFGTLGEAHANMQRLGIRLLGGG